MSGVAGKPEVRVRAPTLRRHRSEQHQDAGVESSKRQRAGSTLRRMQNPAGSIRRPRRPMIYGGSYQSSVSAIDIQRDYLGASGTLTPRTSVSHIQLGPLLAGLEDTKTYGLHEFRDGLFDASFVPATELEPDDAEESTTMKNDPEVIPSNQFQRLQQVLREVTTTRVGVRLLKSFLGFFICYVLCLIPQSGIWLGPYNYLIVVSALFNHPGRSIGAQLDGTVFTCLGSIFGLLWGAFAVWLSSSSTASRNGSGAVVVPFFIISTLVIGWIRCVYGRLYQAVVATGVALFYIALSQNYTDPSLLSPVLIARIIDFLIPWTLGQAICLAVCCILSPSAGNRPLAIAVHSTIGAIKKGLVLPRPNSPRLNRELAFHFVNLSQAVRDFTLDLTYSPFTSNECGTLRNKLQRVIRAMLALHPSSGFFRESDRDNEQTDKVSEVAQCVKQHLSGPTWKLVELSQVAIDMVDYIIMSAADLRISFHVKAYEVDAITHTLRELAAALQSFDTAEEALMDEPALRLIEARHAEVTDIFIFMHPIRLAAQQIHGLLQHASEFRAGTPRWQLRWPTYPWSKALYRMNATVRHDRGGLTAAHYFGSKRQLERTMQELQSRTWTPLSRYTSKEQWEQEDMKQAEERRHQSPTKLAALCRRWLHSIWTVLHRLQDFEARFALKKTLVCTLVSVPAFLPQSSGWWYAHDCWWVTVTVWVMMHPRVGGNVQDLLIRTLCAALGAIVAGIAYAAGNGNPVVIAAFAIIFGLPMIYRYTISNHPRSGVIGCLSFTVISLIIYNHRGKPSVVDLAWTRGITIIIGLVVAVVVNWVLWPFVARHELRKSLATMILHAALVYRRILAIYIYHPEDEEPTDEDVTKSEMIEGRIREGFVRVRQLMALTKHEIRLRGPFDPRPYAAIIHRCEVFFDRLIEVRQTTLFLRPELMSRRDNAAHNLFLLRRDAIASILMLLYTLAGALRESRPLPQYLPSAVLARQRLLDAMDLIQKEARASSLTAEDAGRPRRRWEDVYRYAFSAALTDCVEQVQHLVQLTRSLVGEVSAPQFIPPDETEAEEDEQHRQ